MLQTFTLKTFFVGLHCEEYPPLLLFFYGDTVRFRAMTSRCRGFDTIDPPPVADVSPTAPPPPPTLMEGQSQSISLCPAPRSKPLEQGCRYQQLGQARYLSQLTAPSSCCSTADGDAKCLACSKCPSDKCDRPNLPVKYSFLPLRTNVFNTDPCLYVGPVAQLV